MDSEIQVLKKIWENKEESYIKLISSQTGFSLDYTHYLCNCLLKKEQIKPIKGKRNWYRVTSKGKKGLESRHLIRLPVLKKEKDTEKVTYYFPKKLEAKPLENHFRKVRIKSSKSKLIEAEERKLNLGQSIEKAVSFLKID